MSVEFANRGIVTDGLVFYVDAANTKSYVSGSTTTTDLVSNKVATLQNGTGFAPINAGSWDFDGTDDRIDISPTDNTITGLTYGTLSMWFKIPSTTANSLHGLFTVYESTDFYYALILGDTSSVLLDESIMTVLQYGPGIPGYEYSAAVRKGHTYYFDDTWHNVVFTVESGPAPNTKLYIDGILQTLSYVYGSDSGTGFTNLSSTHIAIGSGYYSGYYNHLEGNIANVAIYDRAITAEEQLVNYNAIKGRFINYGTQ